MTSSNDDPDDPVQGSPPTPDRADDRRSFGKPLCRVFGGPTSHRVQFAGFESHPAASTDAPDADRPPADGERPPRDDADERPSGDDPPSGEPPGGHPDGGPFEGGRDDDAAVRSAGSRAISAVLEQRRAAFVRALDPIGDACWRDEPLEAADLREARSRLYELETAIEEYAARACAGTDPWESAAEHVPEVRLAELLERGECVPSEEGDRADRRSDTDSTEPRES